MRTNATISNLNGGYQRCQNPLPQQSSRNDRKVYKQRPSYMSSECKIRERWTPQYKLSVHIHEVVFRAISCNTCMKSRSAGHRAERIETQSGVVMNKPATTRVANNHTFASRPPKLVPHSTSPKLLLLELSSFRPPQPHPTPSLLFMHLAVPHSTTQRDSRSFRRRHLSHPALKTG